MKSQMLLIALLVLLSATGASSQDGDVSVMVFGTALVPLGRFSQHAAGPVQITRRFGFSYGGKIGLAGLGFGVGAEVRTPVLAHKIYWVISAQYLSHSTNTSDIAPMIARLVGSGATVDYDMGQWLNIPVLTGLAYDYELSEGLKAYGSAQAGLTITRAPYRKVSINRVLMEDTDFALMPAFGMALGMGVELNDRINVGIRYFDMGSPQYEGVRRLNPAYFTAVPRLEMDIPGDERPVTTLMFLFGYRL
jgi:hypothetical protein